jgi:SSS family solute:Na+ symporter
MIKNGPLFMLGAMTSYPLIAVVVGWLVIPFIMKLKVTSAYEILETRLGPAVRLLGSFLFLSLRLLWMAVIIYATSEKVLVPVLGLKPTATPYVGLLLGAITITYTTMGGLRAVVLTDVIQSLILFGGALLALVLITVALGGLDAWWPGRWHAHWPEPVWGFKPGARITFLGGLLATFTWYVCTSGSDQMAIQRYLATRDAKAARNVLVTSLVANTLVTLVMMAVGLAVLAYFRARPELIPRGQTVLSDADTLFPRYIGFGLPMGISGLVIAGLLAAAMSSLSSGVNSSCSVITVDFVDRFSKRRRSEVDQIKLARYVSVLVGIVVIVLSSGVGMVQGNLLEVAFKVVNPLAVPLFGLFFMAMFVRRATGPGTLIGAAFGLTVVITVSYWKEITGTQTISFLWAMPLSLVVQIGVGMLASLIPIGRARPPENGFQRL